MDLAFSHQNFNALWKIWWTLLRILSKVPHKLNISCFFEIYENSHENFVHVIFSLSAQVQKKKTFLCRNHACNSDQVFDAAIMTSISAEIGIILCWQEFQTLFNKQKSDKNLV